MEHEARDDAYPEPLSRPAMARRLLSGSVSRLRRAVGRAADIVLPPTCLSCRSPLRSHDALCVACWSTITFIRAPMCDVLGVPLPYAGPGRNVSAAAVAEPPSYDRARAAAIFNGVMRELIHDFKFHDRQELRSLLSRWLLGAGGELLDGADVIVPVPLARGRLIWRRFNQAAILAQDVAHQSGAVFLPRGLERIRKTRSQVGLSRAERRLNVKGAFQCPEAAREAIRGKSIVIVDDIITTGATVDAAAAALKRVGARRVDVLALAMAADPIQTAV